MSDETPNPAPGAEPETPPASPPANPAAEELAAVKGELAALRAEIAELAKAKPAVPATETPPPAITPKAPDPASLPVYARMAAGYRK